MTSHTITVKALGDENLNELMKFIARSLPALPKRAKVFDPVKARDAFLGDGTPIFVSINMTLELIDADDDEMFKELVGFLEKNMTSNSQINVEIRKDDEA